MKKNLVLSLQAKTMHEMLEQIVIAEFSKIPILEIRADYLTPSELTSETLEAIRDATTKELIFTLRKLSEGGMCRLTDEERYELYNIAIELGFEYIDVEYSSKELVEKLYAKKHNSKIILSYHNFRETDPMDIAENYLTMCNKKPDVVKIATMATKVDDNSVVKKLLDGHKVENLSLTCFCMGELGKESTLYGIDQTEAFTYIASEKRRKTMPGQLTYEELIRLKKTKKSG